LALIPAQAGIPLAFSKTEEIYMKGKLAIFAIASILVTNAFAAMPINNGWYVEGNVGGSKASSKNYPGSINKTGVGWNATLGYKFTQFFSGDVGYTHYADTNIRTPGGPTVATTTQYSYDLAGKVTLPLAKTGVEVFGKSGIGRINSYTHVNNPAVAAANGYVFSPGVHTQTVPIYGGGADYAITPNLLVNAQWMRAQGTNSTGTLDLYSLGLDFIF
jgi:hypothetical protein